jgi:hypothetical protein
MESANTQTATRKSSSEQAELVRRYQKIGISAVAAALAYGDKVRKSASAPVERRIKDRELQVSA